MKPDKIYIDTMFLVRWFLFRFRKRKYDELPRMIEFLREHEEIEKHISVISVAEFVKVLKYNKEFRRYKLTISYIKELIKKLQNFIDLEILKDQRISHQIVKYVESHPELIDCIHLDIAKSNELCFITDEKKIGKLKNLYKNIMTENKLMKQFK